MHAVRRWPGAMSAVVGVLLLAAQACAPAAAPAAPPAPSARPPAVTAPAAAAAVPAPVASSAQAPVQPLNPTVKAKLTTLGLLSEAGTYVALERGYFLEEGIDLELVTFARGPEQMGPLATGELQFGTGSPDASLFNTVARDVGIRIISPNAVANEDDSAGWFAVRQDLVDNGRYRELKDLKGMRWSVNSGFSIATVRAERILALAGLAEDDVQLSVLPYPDMYAALGNGGLDAGSLAEPFVAAARAQRVALPVLQLATVYPNVILQANVVSPVFARENPEAVRRFVAAHLRGQRDYYRGYIRGEGGKDDIVRILIKHTSIKDPETYAVMGTHGVDPNGGIDEAVLDDLQTYYLRYGVQQQRVDSSKIVDRSYLEYALERLGRMSR